MIKPTRSYAEALNALDLLISNDTNATSNGLNYGRPAKAANDVPLRNLSLSQELLSGEEIKHIESDVYFKTVDGLFFGRVIVTNYRLRFEQTGTNKYLSSSDTNLFRNGSEETRKITNEPPLSFDVTLGSISAVEKLGFSKVKGVSLHHYGILIVCKDLRNVRFLNHSETHSRRALYNCLKQYAFPNTSKLPFFATLYKQEFINNGWTLFNIEREFKRQRIPKSAWMLTRINANYEFASTYPSVLAVPASVFKLHDGEEFLRSVSHFRSRQRIPVLSWIDHQTRAAIVRSSQPLVGIAAKKSIVDEQYIEMLISANPNARHLIILDARPSMNAKANRAKGGGYEDYLKCELRFMDIQNIHVVRDSLSKLKAACYPSIDFSVFKDQLKQSGWLAHLQTILDATALCYNEIVENRNSVLIHCSDGWDRTAQLTSLVMLVLDPYFRTIEGFAVLIEKEWCSFGHKFAHAPIFLQFIDCVWQLFSQFTAAFEFNACLLKTILDELYACRFGTFLYNSEKERRALEVKKRTVSFWSYILDNREHFVNASYNPKSTLVGFLDLCKIVFSSQTPETPYSSSNDSVSPTVIHNVNDSECISTFDATTSFIEGGAQSYRPKFAPVYAGNRSESMSSVSSTAREQLYERRRNFFRQVELQPEFEFPRRAHQQPTNARSFHPSGEVEVSEYTRI